jgi:hypothetical protein
MKVLSGEWWEGVNRFESTYTLSVRPKVRSARKVQDVVAHKRERNFNFSFSPHKNAGFVRKSSWTQV